MTVHNTWRRIPSDVLFPLRWGLAGGITQEFLAWAFHNAEARP